MTPEENITWWDFDTVEKFMLDGFKTIGVPEEEAKICANILITADKRGIDSHGVGRFKPIYLDRIWAGTQEMKTKFEIVKESPTTAVIDGHNGMGHYISYLANQTAIDKAKKYGMGMTVVRNSTHYGAACYYPLMAIKEGMIGITGTNARPSIAPTWGVEPMLGTNPLTVGMPTDEEFPFMLDCATSVTQRGKLEVYDRLGKDLPLGWVIGENGEYRTDTKQVLMDLTKGKAALTPLGGLGEEQAGYKGYGYACVVELLSTALSQANYLKMLVGVDSAGKKAPILLGHFFIAISVDCFVELEKFKKQAGNIMRDLRASRKSKGAERIYTPGEKEHDAWEFRKDKGVPFNEPLKKDFRFINEKLNLGYKLPF
ncbi:MAG: lactate dehydrogenase [Deltaproteobacteria bacterium CG_4_10_14_0_2_um_filter_43_8]|nr:MAG: lactate dehydrogenase [Deltaproteobacteria bacterium CG11_big_fil_rev_8_21_14_0_20_49_13]PJA19005.1 MAG: lactate dehydrogenase [Deltaproteobacteria bacterium CG_4_10_14_0_2_um_filter_43_8]